MARKMYALGILLILVFGVIASLTYGRSPAGARTLNNGIDVLGNITNLPNAPDVVYQQLLPVAQQIVTARQALDVAEKEFGFSDTQIDPQARAVPVVVSVGPPPHYQNMAAWVVTRDIDWYLPTPLGHKGRQAHKMCIIIDATTGRYIMAYSAGSITQLQQ